MNPLLFTTPLLGFLLSFLFPVWLNCPETPELNKKVLAYAKSKLNKKVGRGECWDLAAEALNSTNASWDKSYGFGRKVDPAKDCIYQGDIIQFEGVKIRYQEGKAIYEEELDHHTALVYEVIGKGNYRLIEQNTSSHGRKVGLGALQLQNILKGKYQFYRPVASN